MAKPIQFGEVVKKLREFYREHKRPPSFAEVAEVCGYKSKNAAYELVEKLVQKGLIQKDSHGRILLDSLCGTRLLGTVQAGWPSPAEEELVDVLNLDAYLIQHPDQSYLIKVTGDSMIDAGICEGDLVIVERGRTPKDQDIVIAQVDGEWTMKYYQKRGTQAVLIAANKKYPPIVPQRELVVAGVVTGVIRKYK